MKVLVLGGSQFLGRHFVESILHRKDLDITLFNRGVTNAHLFPSVHKIIGDREALEYDAIAVHHWDVVIDFSSYFPSSLERMLQQLKGKIGRYIYISTISVYDFEQSNGSLISEEFPLVDFTEADKTDDTASTYGKRKAACEQVVLADHELDAIIFRPSVVFGPYDHLDRHYHYIYRAHHNLPILLPDGGNQLITTTFVEDLSQVLIKALTISSHKTTYNIVSHPPVSFKRIVQSMADNTSIIDADTASLDSLGLITQNFPLQWGIDLCINYKKLSHDFNFKPTPLLDAIQTTINYYNDLNWPIPNTGISIEQERTVIKQFTS